MDPKPVDERCDHDLFRTERVNLIDHRHELVRLGDLIDWQPFADEWSPQFVSTTGRCFQHDLPCDPSSLVRWRQRIGEAGYGWLLAQSIEAATKDCVFKRASLDEVVLDRTCSQRRLPTLHLQPMAQPCLRTASRYGRRWRHHAAPELRAGVQGRRAPSGPTRRRQAVPPRAAQGRCDHWHAQTQDRDRAAPARPVGATRRTIRTRYMPPRRGASPKARSERRTNSE